MFVYSKREIIRHDELELQVNWSCLCLCGFCIEEMLSRAKEKWEIASAIAINVNVAARSLHICNCQK